MIALPLPLPQSLVTAAAAPLRTALLDRLDRREAVLLEGGEVERVGLACLQVLAAAKAAADGEGLGFAIIEPSNPLREAATLAGVDRLLGMAA